MRWNLQNKLLVTVGLTVFLAQALSTLLHIYELKQFYQEALNVRFEALSQSIVANIIERDNNMIIGTPQRSPESIFMTLQVGSLVQVPKIYGLNKGKGVASIAVISPEAVIATHSDQEKWSMEVQSERLRKALQQHTQMTILDDAMYYTLVPIFAEDQTYLGTVAIGASQTLVNAQIQRLLIRPLSLWAFFLIVILGGIGVLIQKVVLRPMAALMDVIRHIQTGSLDTQAPVASQDEFGQLALAFNRMITQLRTLVGQVQQSGIQVTSSATELAATAKQQEATTAVQVESSAKVLRAVQNISQVTSDLAETMQQVAYTSQETAGFASSGQTDLARMEDAMRRMEEASLSISSRLQTINEKAESITTIVTTINKVADQTNLLSLNASIEAEKAGEYGRGFTVVAREIRRLADQTAVATLDIERMVQQMQSAVSAGVMEMDKFIAEVRQGAQDVERISLQLSRIIEQVQMLSPGFEDVNMAMEHQSQQAQDIKVAVQQLSEEMQETKESLHETYSAIEQLKDVALTLQQQVSQFKVS